MRMFHSGVARFFCPAMQFLTLSYNIQVVMFIVIWKISLLVQVFALLHMIILFLRHYFRLHII